MQQSMAGVNKIEKG